MPLALLAWLGQRSLTQDRIVAEHQSTELAEARLTEAQVLIHGFINELQQSAVTGLSSLEINNTVSSDNIALIRQVIDADPFLDQVFILNAERELLYPQDTVIHSNTERRYVESFTSVLSDENTFRAKPPSEENVGPVNQSRYRESIASSLQFERVSKISDAVSKANNEKIDTVEAGWTTWDTGTETEVYLWHRTLNGVLIAQKLSSAYWLSQLISRLPSGVGENELNGASIRLIDKRQRTIYQWGDYAIGNSSSDDTSVAPISKDWLTYPLDGWRLEYFAPIRATGSSKLLMSVFVFVSLIGLIALGARMIWQEYRREMRNAEQRVSFVNQVSHELKTPLTNICIYADMLETEVTQAGEPDSKRVKKFTNVVTSESQRLARLINNVLNFSRAQQQKISVHKSPASPDQVIKATIDNFTPAFVAKNIAIETDLNAQKTVLIDAEVLEQVLNNLFSNIEKYAADGGLARIHSELVDSTLAIHVSDAGRGIPAILKEKVFEPFERGSDSLIEGVSGTGIGLSIARDLCRLHGGDLELLDSDTGASFKATLHTEASI